MIGHPVPHVKCLPEGGSTRAETNELYAPCNEYLLMREPRTEELPELQTVLDALGDPDCRTIAKLLTKPMTASEISEATDVPLSTTYRKVELLTQASILEERTEIREGGHHTTKYVLDFESLRIAFSDDREFEVSITRPARTADERLSRLWSEVREET
jgi:predicted transcriptional regulator